MDILLPIVMLQFIALKQVILLRLHEYAQLKLEFLFIHLFSLDRQRLVIRNPKNRGHSLCLQVKNIQERNRKLGTPVEVRDIQTKPKVVDSKCQKLPCLVAINQISLVGINKLFLALSEL